jgi:hypothetical protein
MKKFGLIGMAVLAVAIVNVNLNNKSSNKSSNVSKIALKNMEALGSGSDSDSESGGGSGGNKTPTKMCYTENVYSTEAPQWKLKCPVENDQNGIGDCPSAENSFCLGSIDRCRDTTK